MAMIKVLQKFNAEETWSEFETYLGFDLCFHSVFLSQSGCSVSIDLPLKVWGQSLWTNFSH